MKNNITDEEALWWINNRCLGFKIGNEKGEFVGYWGVDENQDFLETVKDVMSRITPREEENETD